MKKFDKELNYKRYIKYLLPSILTMVLVSFYTTIDGFFVSHSSGGELALAGINIAVPILSLSYGFAVMFATGAGAIMSKKMGEGKDKEVNSIFSFITLVLLGIGIFFTVIGVIFLKPICYLLGSSDLLFPYVEPYMLMMIVGFIPIAFKLYFDYLSRTDGNSKIALCMSFIGLILNIILDYLFVMVFDLGTFGAGLGTITAIGLSALIGLIYFLFFSKIRFGKPKWSSKILFKAMSNGSSEMLTELSTGIVTLLLNLTIFKYYGEDGVAAITIIVYLYYFFIAFYTGMSAGAAPFVSYNLGAKRYDQIKKIIRYSFITINALTVIIFITSYGFGDYIIRMFADSQSVFDITKEGLNYFTLLFLFCGFNCFLSSYFTAIGDGLHSAIISTMRTLIFVVIYIFALQPILHEIGVWLCIPFSELTTLFFSIYFYKRYGSVDKLIML